MKRKKRIRIADPGKFIRGIALLIAVILAVTFVPRLFAGRGIALRDYPQLQAELDRQGLRSTGRLKADFYAENLSSGRAMTGSAVYISFGTEETKSGRRFSTDRVVITDAGGLVKVSDRVLLMSLPGEYTVTLSCLGYTGKMTFTVTSPTPDGLTSKALLINRYSTVGSSYVAGTLTVRNDIFYGYGEEAGESRLEESCAEDLHAMFQAAQAEGYELCALSGYRDYYEQKELYEEAGGPAQISVAPPGSSEHQSGLAIDISWGESYLYLYEDMEYSDEYRWLATNSWQYGFILRYPKGFEDVTGYEFEPWHFRYIGREAAALYHETGAMTLEEFSAEPRYQ